GERARTLLRAGPADAAAWDHAAEVFARAGLDARAVEVLSARTDAAPDDAEAWRALAAEGYRSGAYAKGASAAARLLVLVPGDRVGEVLRALCVFLSGDRVEAERLLAPLVDRSPGLLVLRRLAA